MWGAPEHDQDGYSKVQPIHKQMNASIIHASPWPEIIIMRQSKIKEGTMAPS